MLWSRLLSRRYVRTCRSARMCVWMYMCTRTHVHVCMCIVKSVLVRLYDEQQLMYKKRWRRKRRKRSAIVCYFSSRALRQCIIHSFYISSHDHCSHPYCLLVHSLYFTWTIFIFMLSLTMYAWLHVCMYVQVAETYGVKPMGGTLMHQMKRLVWHNIW